MKVIPFAMRTLTIEDIYRSSIFFVLSEQKKQLTTQTFAGTCVQKSGGKFLSRVSPSVDAFLVNSKKQKSKQNSKDLA